MLAGGTTTAFPVERSRTTAAPAKGRLAFWCRLGCVRYYRAFVTPYGSSGDGSTSPFALYHTSGPERVGTLVLPPPPPEGRGEPAGGRDTPPSSLRPSAIARTIPPRRSLSCYAQLAIEPCLQYPPRCRGDCLGHVQTLGQIHLAEPVPVVSHGSNHSPSATRSPDDPFCSGSRPAPTKDCRRRSLAHSDTQRPPSCFTPRFVHCRHPPPDFPSSG